MYNLPVASLIEFKLLDISQMTFLVDINGVRICYKYAKLTVSGKFIATSVEKPPVRRFLIIQTLLLVTGPVVVETKYH